MRVPVGAPSFQFRPRASEVSCWNSRLRRRLKRASRFCGKVGPRPALLDREFARPGGGSEDTLGIPALRPLAGGGRKKHIHAAVCATGTKGGSRCVSSARRRRIARRRPGRAAERPATFRRANRPIRFVPFCDRVSSSWFPFRLQLQATEHFQMRLSDSCVQSVPEISVPADRSGSRPRVP
jgi:hypothetical protein